MKFLVVSDTHKQNFNFFKVVQMHEPDCVIHCGDAEGYEDDLRAGIQCPLYIVAGNCDHVSDELPRELVTEIGGKRILVVHGNKHFVHAGPEDLIEAAKQCGAEIAFYGHTHVPRIDTIDSIVAANPGSISQPRQADHKASYLIVEDDRFGEWHFNIAYV